MAIRRIIIYPDPVLVSQVATVGLLVVLISGCVYLAQPLSPLRAPLTFALLFG